MGLSIGIAKTKFQSDLRAGSNHKVFCDYKLLAKDQGRLLISASVDLILNEMASTIQLQANDSDLLKELFVNEIFGFGCVDFFLPTSDWSMIRIMDDDKILIFNSDGAAETLEFPFSFTKFPTVLAEKFAVELQIRVNQGEPIFERKWGQYVIAAVIPPLSSKTAIQITRISSLLQNWPNTKLPS
jgi:Flp pilus assembly CpaF family ATPase